MPASRLPSLLWPEGYITQRPRDAFVTKFRRKLAILGSTGSIGINALRVAAEARDRLEVIALACGDNIALLARQAEIWRPAWLAVASEARGRELAALLPKGYEPAILYGREGYEQLASLECADIVLSAQAGSAGLGSTLAAARAGKTIALANKESLVLAGGAIRAICKNSGAAILPVDSEHFAIFQCAAGRGQSVKSLILTASGGPFLNRSIAETQKADAQAALNHPTWKMGRKISIDSATMMNKGLEFIEAMHLFGVDAARIRILVHPQSIVHSLVELDDNSQIAQLAVPDMRLAIGGCLLWPEPQRAFIPPLDLARTGQLTFLDPDLEKFACLALALEAAKFAPAPAWRELGLNPACIALNAANEAAVDLFAAGKCRLGDIQRLVKIATAPWLTPDRPLPACGADLADLLDFISAEARTAVAAAAPGI